MADVRNVAIGALHKAAGLLDHAERARTVLSGGDVAFDALEMDSLSRFEAIMQIEDELGLELDDDEVQDLATLNALVAFLEQRLRDRVG